MSARSDFAAMLPCIKEAHLRSPPKAAQENDPPQQARGSAGRCPVTIKSLIADRLYKTLTVASHKVLVLLCHSTCFLLETVR